MIERMAAIPPWWAGGALDAGAACSYSVGAVVGVRRVDAGVVIGVLAVLLGVFLLAMQVAGWDRVGTYGWPAFVIAPGLFFLILAVLFRPATGLAVFGTMVTVTGIILAVQNAFDLWATWGYAWALVAPGASGLGLAIQGLVRRDRGQREAGVRTAFTGLVIFAALGTLLEGAGHISRLGQGEIALPALLILLGLALLASRILRAPRPGAY